jgi:hypothetical protein
MWLAFPLVLLLASDLLQSPAAPATQPVIRQVDEPLLPAISKGQRVIYVCDRDITQEMHDETFLEMINEVHRAICALHETCSFNVIFASDRFVLSFSELGPVHATREMKEACGDFLSEADTESDPGLGIAMRAALAQKPDVIYVVTDSAYLGLDPVLADFQKRKANPAAGGKPPRIHFIVLSRDTSVDKDDLAVMDKFANLSGGSVRFVAPSWPRSRKRPRFSLRRPPQPEGFEPKVEWDPPTQ